MADADPHPAEFGADMGFDRAQAVMAGGAAADLHLDLHRREVELVMEDGRLAVTPKWGLNANDRRLAERYVDAYLWFGPPWLAYQAAPFLLDRALELARTTPY